MEPLYQKKVSPCEGTVSIHNKIIADAIVIHNDFDPFSQLQIIGFNR